MEHPDKFEDIIIPIVICLMKFLIEFYLEFMCLSLTSASNAVHECVMDFVALGVISELDQRYFSSIKDPLKDKLFDQNFRLPMRTLNVRKRIVKAKKKKQKVYRLFWI